VISVDSTSVPGIAPGAFTPAAGDTPAPAATDFGDLLAELASAADASSVAPDPGNTSDAERTCKPEIRSGNRRNGGIGSRARHHARLGLPLALGPQTPNQTTPAQAIAKTADLQQPADSPPPTNDAGDHPVADDTAQSGLPQPMTDPARIDAIGWMTTPPSSNALAQWTSSVACDVADDSASVRERSLGPNGAVPPDSQAAQSLPSSDVAAPKLSAQMSGSVVGTLKPIVTQQTFSHSNESGQPGLPQGESIDARQPVAARAQSPAAPQAFAHLESVGSTNLQAALRATRAEEPQAQTASDQTGPQAGVSVNVQEQRAADASGWRAIAATLGDADAGPSGPKNIPNLPAHLAAEVRHALHQAALAAQNVGTGGRSDDSAGDRAGGYSSTAAPGKPPATPTPFMAFTVEGHAPGAAATLFSGLERAGAAFALSEDVQEQALPNQIVQAIKLQWAQGGGDARVKLQPQYLGELSVSIRVDQGLVTAALEASAPAVREWIAAHESLLRQGLADQGLQLDRLVILDEQPASAPKRDLGSRQSKEQQQETDHTRRKRRGDDATFEVVV